MISRFEIRGRSMLPSLKEGDRVLVLKTKNVKKGDVIVFSESGIDCVKRIHNADEDSVFVLGDNMQESTDSRNYGPISRKQVLGKAILKY